MKTRDKQAYNTIILLSWLFIAVLLISNAYVQNDNAKLRKENEVLRGE